MSNEFALDQKLQLAEKKIALLDERDACIAALRAQNAELRMEIKQLRSVTTFGKSNSIHALAEILLTDCGCSTGNHYLLEKVENRLWDFFDENLAASQAREQQLRESIDRIGITGLDARQMADDALSATSDTTALEALIAKASEVMQEQCAQRAECESIGYSSAIANAIRALPTVKLEDLK